MKFRHRPTEIDAIRWSGSAHLMPSIATWVGSEWSARLSFGEMDENESYQLRITCPNGAILVAEPGDWLIKSAEGEVYPCDPDIFAKSYEAVEA